MEKHSDKTYALWYYKRNLKGNDCAFIKNGEWKLPDVKRFEVVKMIIIEQLHKLCHDDTIVDNNDLSP